MEIEISEARPNGTEMQEDADVLLQVDTLFSLIEKLPNHIQMEALAKIQERLQPLEAVSAVPSDYCGMVTSPQKQLSQQKESVVNNCNIDSLDRKRHEMGPAKEISHSSQDEGSRNFGHSDGEDIDAESKKSLGQATSFNGTQLTSSKWLSLRDCYVRLERLELPKNSLHIVQFAEVDTTGNKNGKKKCPKKIKRPYCQGVTLYPVDPGIKQEENNLICESIIEDQEDSKKKKKTGRPRTVDPSELTCKVCGRQSASRANMKTHMATHSGERPYHCDSCGKTYAQKAVLDCHKKRHNNVKPYKCSTCEYSSVAKIDILRHIPVHTKERNFICEICGKSFATDARVKSHIKMVHQRSDREICETCGFITHSREIMRRHRIIRHTDNENIECPICHIVIKQKGTFAVHMRIHTGERPFICVTCNKSFKSNSQLAAHQRSHQEGKFFCEICYHKFKTRSHLERHAIIHTGDKPFSCHLCPYTCNVKANITKHMHSVHEIRDFTMKDSPVRASDSVDPCDLNAKDRGVTAATEFLKELSQKIGQELTVETLASKEKEKQFMPPPTTVPKTVKVNKKLSFRKAKQHIQNLQEAVAPVSLGSFDAANETVPDNVALPTNPSPMTVTDGALATISMQSHDILSDAMKLLTSWSGAGDSSDEATPLAVETPGETEPLQVITRSTALTVPIQITGESCESLNMYIIQVIPDSMAYG